MPRAFAAAPSSAREWLGRPRTLAAGLRVPAAVQALAHRRGLADHVRRLRTDRRRLSTKLGGIFGQLNRTATRGDFELPVVAANTRWPDVPDPQVSHVERGEEPRSVQDDCVGRVAVVDVERV